MKRPLATPQRPIRKERNILFAKLPPGQVREASEFSPGSTNWKWK